MAFDTTTRGRLAKFVGQARTLLTEEFIEQLQSVYGISPKGDIAPVERLGHLDAEGRELAATLRDRIVYLESSHPDARDAKQVAVDRLTREQAFTVLNRLAAIRMAEKRGLIVESVGQQYQSKGFKVFESVAGSAIGDTYDRYRCYLFCLFDELAIDLGSLFDRRSPQALLFPRETSLLTLLDLLDDADLQDLWAEDETIGWIYQYYNDPAERKKMRDESAAPRNSRELAVRNQFFTPRYVVEFLTDNTLGRIWYEMTQGVTGLKEQCHYLVRRPTEIFLQAGESAPEQPSQDGLSQEELLKQPVYVPHRVLKDPRTILMLDPACGSMHFGLYAFDLFEAIYDEAWEIATGSDAVAKSGEAFAPFCTFAASFADKAAFQREVPRMIVEHNLHGIDIDPRAAQIAGLSLWLRAQRAWHAASVKPVDRPRITRSNIVCAEPMPGDKVLLAEFVEQQFPEGERAAFGFLLETVFDRMTLAGEAGSLLKIEEEIRTAIAEAKKLWEKEPAFNQRMLFGGENAAAATQKKLDLSGITDEQFWEGAEERIYDALRDYAEQAETGGFQRRLFAEDAARGFAFIDICRKRYDVVVMNPPFGLLTDRGLTYAKEHFPHASNDFYAAFVQRAMKSVCSGGRVGVISSRLGFFLDGLEAWRDQFLAQDYALRLLADLGYGVLDALVETAAYVIDDDVRNNLLTAVSALSAREKETVILDAVLSIQHGLGFANAHVSRLSSMRLLPGKVLAYWLSPGFLNGLSDIPPVKDRKVSVYSGLQTDDDFRFLRLRWECPRSQREHRWIPFAKGGEYQPYADDLHLVVNWQGDGAEMKEFVASKYVHWSRHIKNVDRYFTAGLTYSERTTSDISVRAFPKGAIFSVSGPVLQFADDDDLFVMWAHFNCRLGRALIEMAVGSGDTSRSGTAARHYRTGILADTPCPRFGREDIDLFRRCVAELFRVNLALHRSDETHSLFDPMRIDGGGIRAIAKNEWLNELKDFAIASSRSYEIDRAVCKAFGVSEREVTSLAGPHPFTQDSPLRSDSLREIAGLALMEESALCTLALERGVHPRTATKKTFFFSRQFELIAAITGYSTECLVSQLSIAPDLSSRRHVPCAETVNSRLLGIAFGRLDIRRATGEQAAHESPDPFAPLPVCPPGQLQNAQGLPAGPEDVPATYPLKDIPWDGILVDDASHPFDIERRVREVIEIIWTGKEGGPTAEAIEVEACEILGVKTLRDYFRKPANFFADHLKRYSKSRRQAPIYWPLSTKSGSYTLWIYYHRLNDQTLHKCLADFVDPKIKEVESELGNLTGRDSGREADLRDFLNELKDLRDEIERVIKLPWKPNLNDGVLITASPLWKLFRLPKWQKNLKACWEKLEKGEYDWAHLAYTIWPERVEKVCEKDRSIAIAHGLEHLCKVALPMPKTTRGRNAKS